MLNFFLTKSDQKVLMESLLKISFFVCTEEQQLISFGGPLPSGAALEQADDGSLRVVVDGRLQVTVEEALAWFSVAADSA